MRLLSFWGCLLFPAALIIGSVFFLHGFQLVTLMLGFIFSKALYRKLDQAHKLRWLLPCGIVLASLLGCFFYAAELLVFPSDLQGSRRLHLACLYGLIFAFGGAAGEYWSPSD